MSSCTLGVASKASNKSEGRLPFANLMTHDVGTVVLRHLASTQDNVRLSRLISKECRELVDLRVKSIKANLSSMSQPLEQLPLRFPRLEKLAFDRPDGNSASSLLVQLAQHKPGLLAELTVLDLSNCHGMEADALQQVLKACSRLHSLTLPPLAGSVTSSRLEFMEVLCTHGCQLTHLLGVGDYICPLGIHLLSSMTSLTHLDIAPGKANIVLTPPALQPLGQLTNLQSLQLGNHLACYDTCALAASLPGLTSLSFSYVDDFSVSPEDMKPLMASKSLTDLSLCSVTCDDALVAVIARTPVTSLSLHAGSFSASPRGAALLQGRLSKLQLRVNDKDIAAFAAALPQLQGLRSLVVSIHRASESCSELMQAVFGLSQLQQLTVESHYNGLKEQELANLSVLPQLMSLKLSNHFGDITLCTLLRSTPQLQQLQLTGCGAVGDVGLSCAVGHCRKLRDVRLELMRGVSVAGVAAIAAGPCVRRVVLEGCRNVLADECKQVMRLLNKLDLEVVKLR